MLDFPSYCLYLGTDRFPLSTDRFPLIGRGVLSFSSLEIAIATIDLTSDIGLFYLFEFCVLRKFALKHLRIVCGRFVIFNGPFCSTFLKAFELHFFSSVLSYNIHRRELF